MCLGFPITGSESQTLRVGFGGRASRRAERSTVTSPVGRSRSRQQKDDKSKPRKQAGDYQRHYRTEVGPA
jgi:hypothetical protein